MFRRFPSSEPVGCPAWSRPTERWADIKGNAQWDFLKLLAAVPLALIYFLRHGPAYQVYGLLVLGAATVLIVFVFPPKARKRVAVVVGSLFVLLLGIVLSPQLMSSHNASTQEAIGPVPRVVQANLSNNNIGSIYIVGGNQGNVANQYNSPGGSITQLQFTTNAPPAPSILRKGLVSINVPHTNSEHNSRFQTTFDIRVANPQPGMEPCCTGSVTFFCPPFDVGKSGRLLLWGGEDVKFWDARVTILTSNEVKESDFGIFVHAPLH